MVFSVMMVIKGMSYALNNPTKEILYQVLYCTALSWTVLHCPELDWTGLHCPGL